MIRDRKMYVAPTPFALTDGTTGSQTLIVPADFPQDDRFSPVGTLTRIEHPELVVGYAFDLQQNTLTAEKIPNPNASREHHFLAYRLKEQGGKPVTLINSSVDVLPDSNEDE